MSPSPDPDMVAAWHLLELAEQGRPVEQIAQFLASMWVSGDVRGDEMAKDVVKIVDRTYELMKNQELIWMPLLPGGGQGMELLVKLDHAIEPVLYGEKPNTDSNPSSDVPRFDYRMKDIQVDRIIPSGSGMWQLEGYDLDGKHVWIQLIGDLAIQQP